MKRLLIIALLTVAAATPASFGLLGNPTFSRDVPVRVPTSAILVDDHGSDMPLTAAETIRSTVKTPTPTVVPVTTSGSDDRRTDVGSTVAARVRTRPAITTRRAEPGDDQPDTTTVTTTHGTMPAEAGDDHGRTATTHAEAGDDRTHTTTTTHAEAGDDRTHTTTTGRGPDIDQVPTATTSSQREAGNDGSAESRSSVATGDDDSAGRSSGHGGKG